MIVEKAGLYSFFIMFTIGITKGRWNTLVTALQQFKDDYDKNQPIWRILPEFAAANPRYERMGLRDLCQQIHDMYKLYDVARLTTEMYLSDMQPAMKPSDAFAKMAHREIERVPIDELEGRVTAILLTPYPPGIPVLIPGERITKEIPLGRYGHVDEIAGACLFLASAAGGFVSGQVVHVNGGHNMY